MPNANEANEEPTPLQDERKPTTSRANATGSRRLLQPSWHLLAAVIVVAAGLLVWWGAPSAPPVTLMAHMERFEPELVALIERQVEAVRRQPRDARQRATLGLIYEANELWPEALLCYKNATAMQTGEPMWPHHAAIVWLKSDDIDGAVAWLREHAARFPRFAPLQQRLGVALLDLGDLEGADAAFQKVISAAPRISHGYMGRGEVTLQHGEAARAAEFLEKAVALNPEHKAARYLLGRAYRALGRLAEAQRELTLGTGAKRSHLLDKWSRGLSEYAYGIGGRQDRAAKLLGAGQPGRAAEILEGVLESEPDNVAALVNLGTAYLHMGRLEDARDTLLHAERLDDAHFATYINLAACYRRLRRPVEALAYVKRALVLAPGMARAHYTHGVILMQMRRNEEALQALTTAAGYDAQDAPIQQDLANVYVRLRRYAEALESYHTLARMLPTRWEPQLGLGKVYVQLGRLDEARAALEAGLRMAPNEPRLAALAEKLSESGGP